MLIRGNDPLFIFAGGWGVDITSPPLEKKGVGMDQKNKKTFQKLLTILKHFAIMIIVRKGDVK